MATRIVKSYVDTPRGQVHLRSCGDAGADPLILMHWLPWSGRQFEPAMPLLAERGWLCLAYDLLGYGRSDHPDGDWFVETHAQTLGHVLDALVGGPATVVSGHNTAQIAAHFTAEQPDRVLRLVLDGSPAWDDEKRAAIIKLVKDPPPAPDAEGSHLNWAWEKMMWTRGFWDPSLKAGPDTAEFLMGGIIDYLETGLDTRRQRMLEYDMRPALSRIAVPTLALTADTDPLVTEHDKVLGLVPGAVGHALEGVHPYHQPHRIGEWVAVVDAFCRDRFDPAQARRPAAQEAAGYAG